MIQRRKPLARSTKPLKRTQLKRRTVRIKPMSARKLAEAADHAPIREAVFQRDGWRCQLLALDAGHHCFGGLTPHHLLKEKQGGPYEPSNLLTVCAGGNDAIECDPDKFHALGLVVRRGESVKDAWDRMEQVRRRA